MQIKRKRGERELLVAAKGDWIPAAETVSFSHAQDA